MSVNKGEISRLLALKKLQEIYQVLDKEAMQESMRLDMKYKQYVNLTSIEMEEQLKNTSFNAFGSDEDVAPVIEDYKKQYRKKNRYSARKTKNGATKMLFYVKKQVLLFLRSKCKKSTFYCH